jgi:hypothetical protein
MQQELNYGFNKQVGPQDGAVDIDNQRNIVGIAAPARCLI